MAIPAKLEIDSAGWVNGVTHHVSPNHTSGMAVPSGVQGVIMHTMVGNLTGTDNEFMNSNAQVSAHFGIGQDGTIIQWVDTIGGDVAWAEMGGNYAWYSIEHADNGDPTIPLTQAQINSSAQLVELLSRIGNFPLQVTDSTSGEGYGVHYMGGAAWGGHTCPDVPPTRVRSLQRPAILVIAKAIRSGVEPVSTSTKSWTTTGMSSLVVLAADQKTTVTQIVEHTIVASGGNLAMNVAEYLNAGDLKAVMPAGLVLTLPVVA